LTPLGRVNDVRRLSVSYWNVKFLE
jgi:hypothetical protein